MLPSRVFIVVLVVSASILGGCQPARVQRARMLSVDDLPVPTEHRLDAAAEARNKSRRRAWIDEMHRTAPGVNWRAFEKANGQREQARRNAIGARRMTASGAAWQEIGSRNQAGRMHCAALSPDGETLYAGSALGGVWRRPWLGGAWEPLGDNLYGGAHELLILPGENDGDPDVLVAMTDGGLVHVTRDEGLTWETPSGIGDLWWIRGVGVLDDMARTILIYARGPSTGYDPTILASTDYGRTFQSRWQTTQSWDGWMWIPRVGPGAGQDVYVMHEGALRRSTDGGQTCPLVSVIDGSANRGVLAGSEAGAPTLYAALDIGGQWQLHRSDDGGVDWQHSHDISDFWQTMSASILSSDTVFYGGVECYRSTTGGDSFIKINNWGDYYGDPANRLHADIPGLHCWLDPDHNESEVWFVSTDGGLYLSTNGGLTVMNQSLDGLGVGQYYSTLSSSSNWDLIAAGAQDQGYQHGTRQEPAGSGPSTPLDQLISGDYGHLTSSDGTHDLVVSTYPGFILTQSGAINPSLGFIDFPEGADHSWLPPVVADPLLIGSFYFCGDKLYRFTPNGGDWFLAVHSPHDFQVGGGAYISGLAFAPSDPDFAYAVNNTGRLFYSTDHGQSWVNSAGLAPSQHYFYGSTVTVHPTDPLEVAVGGSGYSTPGVVRSIDGGQTWVPQVTGLPQTMVYELVYAEDGSGDLYAATEAGAFRWKRSASAWFNIMSNEAPITLYWSAEVVNDGQTIRFGTYGRGIWDYNIPSSCTALGDCADVNNDGIRDDGCTWWACVAGECSATEVPFGDMGGAFGECVPDGTADGNDRFHALNCFANTSVGGGQYACEDRPPAAFNVDTGGAFGGCMPDGVCDGHDAFAALNAFAGTSSCACPIDGGPAPIITKTPVTIARAHLHVSGPEQEIEPGVMFEIEVFLETPLDDLRGYQLHLGVSGGRRGTLEIVDIAMLEDTILDHNPTSRRDSVRTNVWSAFNTSTAQMVAGMDGPARAVDPGYLATFTLSATSDALGVFEVDVQHDPDGRTFLFPGAAGQRIATHSRPAVIRVRPQP